MSCINSVVVIINCSSPVSIVRVEASVGGSEFLVIKAKMPLAHGPGDVLLLTQDFRHGAEVQRKPIGRGCMNGRMLQTCMVQWVTSCFVYKD